jgi:hypothetical protein
MDLADFTSELVTYPPRAAELSMKIRDANTASVMPTKQSIQELHEHWVQYAANAGADKGDVGQQEQRTFVCSGPASRAYRLDAVPSVWTQTRLCAQKQFKLNFRNKSFIFARWINVTVMSIILGTIALNTPLTAFQVRFGLALYTCIFM